MVTSTLLTNTPRAATQRTLRTITLAFLACGCRTVYDGGDKHDGEVVVCPNLYTCDGHDGGWTTINQALAGSLPRPVRNDHA
jgi:hypothetical protein